MGAPIARLELVPAPAPSFLNDLEEGGTAIVCGITGYGKTFTLQCAVAGARRRLAVIDPYARLDRLREARGTSRRCKWEGDLFTFDEIADNPNALRAHDMRVVLDPGTLEPFRMGWRIKRIMELLWAAGDVDVVLEESGLYSRWIVDIVNRFCTGAGHTGLRCYLVAQGYSRITLDARRNPTRVCAFAQVDESDYNELKPKIGDAGVAQLKAMLPRMTPVLWKQGDVAI